LRDSFLSQLRQLVATRKITDSLTGAESGSKLLRTRY